MGAATAAVAAAVATHLVAVAAAVPDADGRDARPGGGHAGAGGRQGPPPGVGGPPPGVDVPDYLRVGVLVSAAAAPVFGLAAYEAPFEFRLNAAWLVAGFDCVGTYAAPSADRSYTTWDGGAVSPAPAASRTDDNMGFCLFTVLAAMVQHLVGSVYAEPIYAAAAGGGFDLPRLGDGAACPPARGGGVDLTKPGCAALAITRRYIREHLDVDGMNSDGTAGLPPGAPPRPYFDAVSGYTPVNGPAAGVTNVTRWTPLTEDTAGLGTYTVQTVTAAQVGLAKPLMVPPAVLRRLRTAAPYPAAGAYAPDFVCDAGRPDPDGLCGKARGVLAAAASLTDTQRLLVRFFDRKSTSIARFPTRLLTRLGQPLADYLVAEAALNSFAWDATIVTWSEKLRHDAVRPATLVPAILWHDPRGAAFTSTIRTMPHGEYPSGSATVCAGFAAVLSAFGGDALNVSFTLRPGQVGGGLPTATETVDLGSLAAVASTCAASRLWGGLHFPDAVAAGETLGKAVAAEVLKVMACRAPGTPGLPACEAGGTAGGRAGGF